MKFLIVTWLANSDMPPKWSPCQWVVIRLSICVTPASFMAAMMRPASRGAAAPGFPVSISTDSPDGVTNKVAFPPSTSTTYMSKVLRACACAAGTNPARQKPRTNIPSTHTDLRIDSSSGPTSPAEEHSVPGAYHIFGESGDAGSHRPARPPSHLDRSGGGLRLC